MVNQILGILRKKNLAEEETSFATKSHNVERSISKYRPIKPKIFANNQPKQRGLHLYD